MRKATRVAAGVIGVSLMQLLAGQAVAQRITVGKNVHITTDHPRANFWEVSACANPNNPNELVAVPVLSDPVKTDPRPHHVWDIGSTAYRSSDGGKTWKQIFYQKISQDPTCGFGPDGALFMVASTHKGFGGVTVTRDGGKTWTAAEIPQHTPISHGPFISIDNTQGPFRGRAYISTFAVGDGIWNDTPVIWSADGGKTFTSRIVKRRYGSMFGNNVILPDGMFAFLMAGETDTSRTAEGYPASRSGHTAKHQLTLQLFRSRDGGESFLDPVTVASIVTDDREQQGVIPAWIGADPGSSAFSGRLYVVWADSRTGRQQILAASSGDGGDSWTSPVLVDHDIDVTYDAGFLGKGPNNFLPSIAVNKDGIVGITWHDRRDVRDNIGHRVRFSASLDGGETWLPSVPVSTHVTRVNMPTGSNRAMVNKDAGGRFYIHGMFATRNAGDYAGLVADAAGRFHAIWNDNRNGNHQIYTAPITVSGRPSSLVAGMKDLTSSLELSFDHTQYDRRVRTLVTDVTIRNAGTDTLTGPLVLRINRLRSVLARTVTVDHPTTRKTAGTAMIVLSGLENNRLTPGKSVMIRGLTFRVANMVPLTSPAVEDTSWHGVTGRLVEFDARVYQKR
jgi:hypothetical protein